MGLAEIWIASGVMGVIMTGVVLGALIAACARMMRRQNPRGVFYLPS